MARRTVWAATALLVTLLVWAATHGPAMARRVSPPSDLRVDMPPISPPEATTSSASVTPPPPRPLDMPPSVEVALALFVLGAAAIACYVAWRLFPRRRPTLPAVPTIAPRPGRLLDEEAAEEQRTALAQGSPRNAIVACWVELEQLVARAGVRRDPSETPSELARRVLRDLDVPDDPVERLSEAYREARFSRHPIVESDRETAAAALDEIHAALLGRSRA